ncbi:hypothetical protein ACTGZQ_05705 [Streptococcus suis]
MLTVCSVAKIVVVVSDVVTESSASTWSAVTPPATAALAAINPRNIAVADD